MGETEDPAGGDQLGDLFCNHGEAAVSESQEHE
jgi:hypothetical protein